MNYPPAYRTRKWEMKITLIYSAEILVGIKIGWHRTRDGTYQSLYEKVSIKNKRLKLNQYAEYL